MSDISAPCLEGDLVIRDGAYVTDNDVRMRVHGIYVPEVGRLNAVLEPIAPIRLDISEQDRIDGNAYYRCPIPSTCTLCPALLQMPSPRLNGFAPCLHREQGGSGRGGR